MNNNTYQIYDRIIKKILLLSSKAVIHLINGLFDTDYSTDSILSYNWTEHVDNDLNKRLADTILTINGNYSYHIEAQIVKDEDIAFRVFEYGYHHALKQHGTSYVLKFPTAKVIYLCENPAIRDIEEIVLDFGKQGSFTYQVESFKLINSTIQDLHNRKMIILIPFLILRFKKKMQRVRTPKLINELQIFILHDIINAIQMNVDIGNITGSDGIYLRELTFRLYKEVFAHYEELKKGGVNDMIEDNFVLEAEIWEQRMKEHTEEALLLEAEVWEQRMKEHTEEALLLEAEVWEQRMKEHTEKALNSQRKEVTVNLYQELQDINKVAYILKLPAETVQEYLEE